ncbi:TPA: hypothetical protein ACH3X1_003277 [Trebouxia sp. C0004]
MGNPVTTAQPAAASPSNESSSASPGYSSLPVKHLLERDASDVKQQQPRGINQAGNLTRDEQNRINQEAEALSDALAAVKDRGGWGGGVFQSRTLGELRAWAASNNPLSPVSKI